MQLIAAGPAKQRRLTVAFRLILAIPQGFVLFFLGVAAGVVAFLGWWGALFMGRLPNFAVSYLSGYIRWYVRFYGYVLLLTDDYPPFSFADDPAYPVVIAIPPAGRLNRFAVFFRFILFIWADIVAGLVSAGAGWIVAFIAWLITLITGKLPTPLHLAYTAVLRYQTRFYCYTWMLTPTYAWKLFGDEPDVSAPVTAPPAGPAWGSTPVEPAAWGTPPAEPAAWGTPAAEPGSWGNPPAYGTPPADGTPPAYGATPGYDTTLGYGTPAVGYGTAAGYGSAQPAFQPANWRLVLPQSAKTLLIVFIVLGVIIDVGGQIARAAATNRTENAAAVQAAAVTQWNSAYNTLKTQVGQDSTTACGQNLSCFTKADTRAAGYLTAFASEVQAITMPSTAAPDATTVVADATKAAQDFTTLSAVTGIGLYQSTYSGLGLAQELQTFQQDVSNLATALSNANP
ncbi:MAG TPA: DUF4389 domain-containing protein [Streptosporangiaceae bacterium]|nr:DUF4389 domain-containing protein [Streptosporangiaceae bacterium]